MTNSNVSLRNARRLPPLLPGEREVKGLGGWMILPILGLFGTIILMCGGLIIVTMAEMKLGWSESSGIYASTKYALLFLAASFTCVFISAIVSLAFIFYRSKLVPGIVTVHYAFYLSAAVLAIECERILTQAFGLNQIADLKSNAIGITFYIVLWATYFNRSKRAKNTFVR